MSIISPVFPDLTSCTDKQHRELLRPCSIFPFMQLPKELRLQIYGYLSTPMQKPIDCASPKRFGHWSVSIFPPALFACRAIHDEAMDLVNDRKPAAVLCRANQQQKYCALQAALQRGCDIDRAWLATTAGNDRGGHMRVSPAAVEAALQNLLEKVPYSQQRSMTKLANRHRDLRHFFAQNIIRLRRDPQILLTVYVERRPYRRFFSWYGSPTCARYVAWFLRDMGEVWLLRCNLLNAITSGQTRITTKMAVRGAEGDEVFEAIKIMFEKRYYRRSEDVECVPLEKNGFHELLNIPDV